MKYKNENVFNVVQGNCHFKENDSRFYSTHESLKMDAFQQYSAVFCCYDDEMDQEKDSVTSADSPMSYDCHRSNNHPAVHSTTINCSSSGPLQPSCASGPLSSSTNQLSNSIHLHRLPANNPFIHSSSPVVSSSACFTNRIPLPGELEANSNGSFDTDSLIRLRNLRERNRVRNVNDGFDRLRKHLPNQLEFKKDKRLSKVQTLKMAITYIRQLESILQSSGKQLV